MGEPTLADIERLMPQKFYTDGSGPDVPDCMPLCGDPTARGGLTVGHLRSLLAHVRELRAALAALDRWCDERREATTVTTLGHVQERIRAVLAHYPEEPSQGGTTP